MKFYYLLCTVIFTLSCNYKNEQLQKDDELKKKEIELRMRELEIKEKELKDNEIILEEKQRDFEDKQAQNIKKETENETEPLTSDNFGNLWTNSAGDYLSFKGNRFSILGKGGTFELINNTLKLYFDDNTQKRFRFYFSDEKNLYMLTNDRGNYFYESALSNKHK